MENAFEINCTNLLSDIFLMKRFCLVKMRVFHVMVFIRLLRTKTKSTGHESYERQPVIDSMNCNIIRILFLTMGIF